MSTPTKSDDLEETLCKAGRLQAVHDAVIETLCESIGYGNVMASASRLWRAKCNAKGMPLSNFSVGPCECMTVPCPHPERTEDQPHCDWCCGSGWLTKHVAGALREKAEK